MLENIDVYDKNNKIHFLRNKRKKNDFIWVKISKSQISLEQSKTIISAILQWEEFNNKLIFLHLIKRWGSFRDL